MTQSHKPEQIAVDSKQRVVQIRWDDGHESTFFPSAGSVKIVEATKAGKEVGA